MVIFLQDVFESVVQLDGANYFMCDLEFKKVGTFRSPEVLKMRCKLILINLTKCPQNFVYLGNSELG